MYAWHNMRNMRVDICPVYNTRWSYNICRTFNNRTKLDFTHHHERVRQSSRWPRPPRCHADDLAPHDALDDCIREKKNENKFQYSSQFCVSLIRQYCLQSYDQICISAIFVKMKMSIFASILLINIKCNTL